MTQAVWPPAQTPVTIREVIRRAISAALPEVEGRVFENDLPLPNTKTPFVVVRMGNDSVISSWGARATPVQVWPFVGIGDAVASYRLLDLMIDHIVAALTPNGESAIFDEAAAMSTAVNQTPGRLGNRYLISYNGVMTQDTRDETLQALTRPISFDVIALVWRSEEAQPFIATL